MSEFDLEEFESRLELSERKRIRLQKMLTQKAAAEETPLWSMVDLMTLLLIFFLFFYASAVKGSFSDSYDSTDESAGFQIETSPSCEEKAGINTIQEFDQTQVPASPALCEVKNSEQSIEQFREEVLKTMDEGDKDVFSVTSDQRRLVFVLGERITFEVGEARLIESYKPIFVRIAHFISSKHGYQVVVSGHTDNKPISTAKYPSNLELSSARAITVAKFLIYNGVAPHRVSIQGFSEYHPLFENTTPENRQANRRVAIALIKEQGKG